MVTMRAVRTGPRSLDLGGSLRAGIITGIGSVTTVAALGLAAYVIVFGALAAYSLRHRDA